MAFRPKSHTFLRGDLEGILKGLSRAGRRGGVTRSAYERGYRDALDSLAQSLNIDLGQQERPKRRRR